MPGPQPRRRSRSIPRACASSNSSCGPASARHAWRCQVFANLLDNAAKYTDRGGQIWVSAKRDGECVVVAVRDNGIGIPAEALPKLFEMFAQVPMPLERAGRRGYRSVVGAQPGGTARRHDRRPQRGARPRQRVRGPPSVGLRTPNACVRSNAAGRVRAAEHLVAPYPDRRRCARQRRHAGDGASRAGPRSARRLRRTIAAARRRLVSTGTC